MLEFQRAAPGRQTGWFTNFKLQSNRCARGFRDTAADVQPAHQARPFSSANFDELKANSEFCQPIVEAAHEGKVTLIYSSHDADHNNAVALQEFLQRQLRKKRSAHKRAA